MESAAGKSSQDDTCLFAIYQNKTVLNAASQSPPCIVASDFSFAALRDQDILDNQQQDTPKVTSQTALLTADTNTQELIYPASQKQQIFY